jgi:hypothetical protein
VVYAFLKNVEKPVGDQLASVNYLTRHLESIQIDSNGFDFFALHLIGIRRQKEKGGL